MTPEKNGNSRGWRNFTTIGFALSLAFIFLDRVITPGVNSGKLADAVYAQGKQIAVLEDVIVSLRPLPVEVAALKESLAGVKKTLDRIEGMVNDGKDKR